MKIELELNDVYRFSYNSDYLKKHSYTDHCFDGQLIVKKNMNDELYLADTYWGSGDNKWFTLEKALDLGNLTFVCNLKDVESINLDVYKFYKMSDIFNLSSQHGCHKNIVLKKGAKRDSETMLNYLKKEIENKKSDIKYNESQIILAEENIKKINSGNLNIYI